jgi:hypothetical protein
VKNKETYGKNKERDMHGKNKERGRIPSVHKKMKITNNTNSKNNTNTNNNSGLFTLAISLLFMAFCVNNIHSAIVLKAAPANPLFDTIAQGLSKLPDCVKACLNKLPEINGI